MTSPQLSPYDRLKALTDEYLVVQVIDSLWRGLARLSRQQANLLGKQTTQDPECLAALAAMEKLARGKAAPLDRWLEKRQAQMNTLNAEIQNGVFDD